MSDQCAQDSDGNLKDASEITFYESESDEKALPAVPSGPLHRGIRKRNTDKLVEGLTAENADEDGNPQMKRAPRASTARAARVQTVAETPSEEEDDDFEMPGLEDVSDSDDSDSRACMVLLHMKKGGKHSITERSVINQSVQRCGCQKPLLAWLEPRTSSVSQGVAEAHPTTPQNHCKLWKFVAPDGVTAFTVMVNFLFSPSKSFHIQWYGFNLFMFIVKVY
ncbi:hypothetical protein B0H11DRAFT_1902322 [Mycena galericulata]|nr:hypothetical protein B0H11DRAFT_1902322 [Mycena galericulata]